jgi:hypothetical protein
MEIPSLDTALVRLTKVFPYYIEFMLALMALGGLFLVASGLVQGYRTALDSSRRGQMYGDTVQTPWKSLMQIALGGALAVPLVLMWKVAGTFVLGGDETYNMLSYLPPPDSSPWCDRVKAAIVLFWMSMGITGIAWSAVLANERIKSGRTGGTGQALVFFFGGLVCFFIPDAAVIVSNTFGLDFSLDNVCSIMGDD